MFKNMRFLGLFFLVLVLFSAPAGQTVLSTFFGPVTFARGVAEPIIEVRQFGTPGFSAPFLLHLRNGNEDRTNRVSSASVRLNGKLIFGPQHFSQRAWAYDIEVDLLLQNTLEVNIASMPGSMLTIWIDGSPIESPEVRFTPGNEVSAHTTAIGPGGLTYIFNDGGPLDGVSVEFPPNALDDLTEVVFGYNQGQITPIDGVCSGTALSISTPGVEHFNLPVIVTVPFSNPDKVPIPYHAHEDGTIQPVQLISIDRVNNNFKFLTYHASWFIWIIDLLFPNLTGPPSLDTGFRPNPNGFQVVNNGSWISTGGECFGMTSFSLWFWENYGTPLFGNYISPLGNDRNGDPLTAQDVIATRAHTSISSQWYAILPLLMPEIARPTDRDRFESICNIINNTKNPALIYLGDDNGTPLNFADDNAHSVLAYMYDSASGSINIYDPNFPGLPQTINYVPATGAFNNYGIYELITFQGCGSEYQRERYEDILLDADINFNNSPEPTIETNSFPPNCFVVTKDIHLLGRVYSVEARIEEIEVKILAGSTATAKVLPTRTFEVPLTLMECENSLNFNLYWTDNDGNQVLEGRHNYNLIFYPITLIDITTSVWTIYAYPPGEQITGIQAGMVQFDGKEVTINWPYEIDGRIEYYSEKGNYFIEGLSVTMNFADEDGSITIRPSLDYSLRPNLMVGLEYIGTTGDADTVYWITRERCGLPLVASKPVVR